MQILHGLGRRLCERHGKHKITVNGIGIMLSFEDSQNCNHCFARYADVPKDMVCAVPDRTSTYLKLIKRSRPLELVHAR